MSFTCLTHHAKGSREDQCWPEDYDTCSPETDMCGPDYGSNCKPDCDPEEGADDPYDD